MNPNDLLRRALDAGAVVIEWNEEEPERRAEERLRGALTKEEAEPEQPREHVEDPG